jgi:hypothetical protein
MREKFLFALLVAGMTFTASGTGFSQDSATDFKRDWPAHSELVFDKSSGQSRRTTFSAARMTPDTDLDFVWTPAPGQDQTGADGRISGRGRIVWYSRGDHAVQRSPLAEYVGDMKAGLRDGHGSFGDASGFRYEGDWIAGLPEGKGYLSRANGDEWQASFVGGRATGVVHFTSGSGDVYDGDVSTGIRLGRIPTDIPELQWLLPDKPSQLTLAQAAPAGVSISVVADRRRTAQDRKHILSTQECSINTMGYDSAADGQILKVIPDSKLVMGLWKGNINLYQPTTFCFDVSSVPLSFMRIGLSPAFLLIEAKNGVTSPITIAGAYLDVSSSATDTQPAIQFIYSALGDCGGGLNPQFSLENLGWGPALNAQLRLKFQSRTNTPSQSITRTIPSLVDQSDFDMTDDLKRFGVNVALLSGEEGLPCKGSQARCLASLVNKGVFGKIGNAVRVDPGGLIRARLSGTLQYSWIDNAKGRHDRSSPIEYDVDLGWFHTEGECGAPGPEDVVRAQALVLKVDQNNYRVALPFHRVLNPNETGRFAFAVEAPRSSQHRFTIVLLLADGRRIVSRPVDLLYYRPRQLTKP